MSKKKNVDYDPKTGIFINHNYKSDYSLAKKIIEIYNDVEDVADMGAGEGVYCKYFEDNTSWKIDGYEGNKNAYKNKRNKNLYIYDLTKPLNINELYDLVICLEVGEHIPNKYQNIFLENITKICKKYLLLSWAVPGQGGKGHVNCLSNKNVISLVSNYGRQFEKEKSEIFRKNSSLKFFKNTLMAFKRV